MPVLLGSVERKEQRKPLVSRGDKGVPGLSNILAAGVTAPNTQGTALQTQVPSLQHTGQDALLTSGVAMPSPSPQPTLWVRWGHVAGTWLLAACSPDGGGSEQGGGMAMERPMGSQRTDVAV